MDAASSRERSPLRYPASANIGLPPSFASMSDIEQQTFPDFAQAYNNNTTQPTFDQQTGLDQTQYIPHTFAQSAQHPEALDISNYQSLVDANSLPPTLLSNHIQQTTESGVYPGFDINDNSLINDIDLLQQQHQQQTVFSNDAMSTATSNHASTPPHLLSNTTRKSSSPSPLVSLNTQQNFINRPRNASGTLDPNSAYDLPQQNGDWAHVARGHRRGYSDNLSDVSSHSAQASPYLGTMESFENDASPMLSAQDPMFNDALGMGQFSISENPMLQQRRQSYQSPAHSPLISPNLMPAQQPLPPFTASDNFGLSSNGLNGNEQYIQDYNDISPSNEMGLADQMSPPEIKLDPAPPMIVEASRLPQLGLDDGLSPPPRSRARAKSDPHLGSSRPMVVPAMANRGRSPSLQPNGALSPFAGPSNFASYSNPASREPSPGPSNVAPRGRSASAASDRDRMLGLADPARSPSNSGEGKRQQKHPATFSCHLCTKRFTRAYNLRSHLRTHTDERPFVCTVCDKAFARQHDRKRHEGLHSGEKKFVCRGPLKSGGNWGCNRRFARADALGRHFRSEAGRVCIKPLLDEEANEQQQAMWQQHEQAQAAGYPAQIPDQLQYFPQALLQQFPDLRGVDWTQPQYQSGMADDDYGGRSSFEHSSGAEMYDELSENEMGIGSMNANAPAAYAMPHDQQAGPSSSSSASQQQQQQQQQHQLGYSGPSIGVFTNGFEGR